MNQSLARRQPAMSTWQRLKAFAGLGQKAQSRTSGRVTGRVLPDLSIWNQFQRTGGSVTPQDVSEIIRQADAGYMWRLMDLANDSRQKDCHLQSVLQTSEDAVAGLDWELQLPKKTNKRDRDAAAAIEEVLRANTHLTRLFSHQTGARFIGYGVSETCFKRYGAQLWPDEKKPFEFHAPRRFGFEQFTGKFVWRDWNMPEEGVDFLEKNPLQFIVSRPRVTGDVPCREGLVRVLMWASLFRNWTLSDWLKLGEIAWKPWRMGKFPMGTSQENIDDLVAILEGMTTSGVAVYPSNLEVEIEWPTGQASKNSPHADMFMVLAGEISKVVLGQTETTESSNSSGYAQAKVHNEIRKELRDATARWVADDISRDLIAVLTFLNFGPDVRPARLRFLTEESTDAVKFGQAMSYLAGPNVRMRIPAPWARQQLGIPEPDKGEEILGPNIVDVPIDPKTGKPVEQSGEPDAGKEKPAKDDGEDTDEGEGDGAGASDAGGDGGGD